MKKTFLALLILALCLPVLAQKNKTSEAASADKTSTLALTRAVYNRALQFNDLGSAIYAIYNLMELQPENKALKDTLCLLYFNADMLPQAVYLGEELIKVNPDAHTIREVLAISKQAMGKKIEALSDYEKVYAYSKRLTDLYQIATLQYELKRFGECIASLDQILADKSSATEKISIAVYNDQRQEVTLAAAAYNVKGVVALEINKTEDAKAMFAKSVEAYHDFILPQRSLEFINQSSQQKDPKSPPSVGPK